MDINILGTNLFEIVWSGLVHLFGSVLELFGNAVLSPGNQNIMIFIELEEC